jgi:hypothetical protein
MQAPDAPGTAGLREDALWEVLRIRASRILLAGTSFLICGLFLGLFAGAYLTLGSQLIENTNTTDADLQSEDQRHAIKLAMVAKQIRTGEGEFADQSQLEGGLVRQLPHYTDGVMAPLWPWLGSFLLPDEAAGQVGGSRISEAERAQFIRGKWFLITIGCAFLVLCGVILLHFFSQPAVFIILLAGGLGAILPRAAFYQPEPLSYILLAISWGLVLFLLGRNTLPGYLLLGVSLGLAYLAKTSIQPLVGGFLLATTLRWFLAIRSCRGGNPVQNGWNPTVHGIGLMLLILTFCLVTGPRLIHSKRQFGSMTHDYPSYWMWTDRIEDGYRWMEQHGDAETIEAAGKQTPSLFKYLGSHTLGDIRNRLVGGTAEVVGRFFSPPKARRDQVPAEPWNALLEHRGGYLGILSLIAIGMGAQYILLTGTKPRLPAARGMSSAVFIIATFTLAGVTYGWYSPIAAGDHFMLSLYLPLVLTLVWLTESLHREIPKTRLAGRLASHCYIGSMGLVCGALIWRTIELLSRPEFA